MYVDDICAECTECVCTDTYPPIDIQSCPLCLPPHHSLHTHTHVCTHLSLHAVPVSAPPITQVFVIHGLSA